MSEDQNTLKEAKILLWKERIFLNRFYERPIRIQRIRPNMINKLDQIIFPPSQNAYQIIQRV